MAVVAEIDKLIAEGEEKRTNGYFNVVEFLETVDVSCSLTLMTGCTSAKGAEQECNT